MEAPILYILGGILATKADVPEKACGTLEFPDVPEVLEEVTEQEFVVRILLRFCEIFAIYELLIDLMHAWCEDKVFVLHIVESEVLQV